MTLRDKVAQAVQKRLGDPDDHFGCYFPETDAALQAVADDIGVSVEGLEYLREAITLLQSMKTGWLPDGDAVNLSTQMAVEEILAKLKGQDNG